MPHDVRIHTDSDGAVRVTLDGQEVKGLTSYSVSHDAGCRPEVTLTIAAESINKGVSLGDLHYSAKLKIVAED